MTVGKGIARAFHWLTRGEREKALAAAQGVMQDHPEALLPSALASYLQRFDDGRIYDEPTAFEAFIDNGGNVELYEQTIRHLLAVHRGCRPVRVLDIGPGDGRVIAAVLTIATRRIDLVEPSGELLDMAVDRLRSTTATVRNHQMTASEFMAARDPGERWDLVQSTFALHAISPKDRAILLAQLAERTGQVAIVEFDVPVGHEDSVQHLEFLGSRYELGLREYVNLPEVITGFLLPVLVGQLDPERQRHTFEQSTEAWCDDLAAAGFTPKAAPVCNYWWSPAVLIQGFIR